jgi:hypothetical protein
VKIVGFMTHISLNNGQVNMVVGKKKKSDGQAFKLGHQVCHFLFNKCLNPYK